MICEILAAWAGDIAVLRDGDVPREVISGYYYQTPDGPEKEILIPLIPIIYESRSTPDQIESIMREKCESVIEK